MEGLVNYILIIAKVEKVYPGPKELKKSTVNYQLSASTLSNLHLNCCSFGYASSLHIRHFYLQYPFPLLRCSNISVVCVVNCSLQQRLKLSLLWLLWLCLPWYMKPHPYPSPVSNPLSSYCIQFLTAISPNMIIELLGVQSRSVKLCVSGILLKHFRFYGASLLLTF